jgi:hypothetical protein
MTGTPVDDRRELCAEWIQKQSRINVPFKKGVTPPGAKPYVKGQSGNPAGKAPGTRNVKTILRQLLEIDSEKTPGVSRLEAICAKLVVMAEGGDLYSIDRVFDRLEGKPGQSVDVTATKTRVRSSRRMA